MKLKKVLSGIVASAMMFTTMAVSPMTVSAVDYVDVELNVSQDWFSAVILRTNGDYSVAGQAVTNENWWSQIDRQDSSNTDTVYASAFGSSSVSESNQSFTVSVDSSIGSVTFVTVGWSNKYNENVGHEITVDTSKAVDNKVQVQLVPNGDPATEQTNNWYYLQDVTVKYLAESTDPTVYNEWIKNDDNTYTYNCAAKTASDTDDWNGTAKYLTGVDYSDYLPSGMTNANIRKINVTVSATGGSSGGSAGSKTFKNDGSDTWTQIDQSPFDGTVISLDAPYGVPDEATLQVGVDWINYKTKLTVKIELETADIVPESISLDKDKLDFTVGDDPVKLTATVEPANANYDEIVWTSSDTAVATVDENGNVTPVAAGTATITAAIKGTELSADCAVTVSAVEPTSIKLDKTSLTLTAGGTTAKLAATVLPEGAEAVVEWTSSDKAVATVADGVVTPVAAGKATITASIKGTELSADCAVTVIEDVIEPESITIDKTSLKLTEGDAPVTLTATVLPEGAEAVVEWSSSNTAVATVDAKGTVTAVAEGKAVITASVKDTDLSASCSVEVVAAEEEPKTGYTGAEELPVNTVAVQKTPVVNGTYNDRFVLRVSEDMIANASEVIFTLNNGTKTVTYSTNKYYTSLTVNGTKTSAGDGYVLLTLTVKDIPEDVTVTCDLVSIK